MDPAAFISPVQTSLNDRSDKELPVSCRFPRITFFVQSHGSCMNRPLKGRPSTNARKGGGRSWKWLLPREMKEHVRKGDARGISSEKQDGTTDQLMECRPLFEPMKSNAQGMDETLDMEPTISGVSSSMKRSHGTLAARRTSSCHGARRCTRSRRPAARRHACSKA